MLQITLRQINKYKTEKYNIIERISPSWSSPICVASGARIQENQGLKNFAKWALQVGALPDDTKVTHT